MKTKFDSYGWPYTSLFNVDSNGSLLCAAEGITFVEQPAPYPGQSRYDIFVINVDGIVNETSLGSSQMNLPNASFFWDSCHLLKKIWPMSFGELWSDFCVVVFQSKDGRDTKSHAIHCTYKPNDAVINKGKEISNLQKNYARYYLKQRLGT